MLGGCWIVAPSGVILSAPMTTYCAEEPLASPPTDERLTDNDLY